MIESTTIAASPDAMQKIYHFFILFAHQTVYKRTSLAWVSLNEKKIWWTLSGRFLTTFLRFLSSFILNCYQKIAFALFSHETLFNCTQTCAFFFRAQLTSPTFEAFLMNNYHTCCVIAQEIGNLIAPLKLNRIVIEFGIFCVIDKSIETDPTVLFGDFSYPPKLIIHYILKLVSNDVEFHHRVGAKNGTSKGKPRVVGTFLLSPVLSFGNNFRPLAGTAKFCKLCCLCIVFICCIFSSVSCGSCELHEVIPARFYSPLFAIGCSTRFLLALFGRCRV